MAKGLPDWIQRWLSQPDPSSRTVKVYLDNTRIVAKPHCETCTCVSVTRGYPVPKGGITWTERCKATTFPCTQECRNGHCLLVDGLGAKDNSDKF